jgi:methylenetetrahydrofolate dehydrogenase (NADP+)/methenyltetrahydrofolate cyclohydrolase
MSGASPKVGRAGTMTAKNIDGHIVARKIRSECRERVLRIIAQSGSPPRLAVILVGSDPASRLYVKNKIRACADVGIQSFRYDFPADVKQDAIIEKIEELNEDPSVHGILVQLPLPPSFDMARILRTISADKDVDGFHLYNVGGLVAGGTVFPPARPMAFSNFSNTKTSRSKARMSSSSAPATLSASRWR